MINKDVNSDDLQLFKDLQQTQSDLWLEIQSMVADEPDDISWQYEQEQTYRERLREREDLVAAKFDVAHQYLREILLRGVSEGWPWEDA